MRAAYSVQATRRSGRYPIRVHLRSSSESTRAEINGNISNIFVYSNFKMDQDIGTAIWKKNTDVAPYIVIFPNLFRATDRTFASKDDRKLYMILIKIFKCFSYVCLRPEMTR